MILLDKTRFAISLSDKDWMLSLLMPPLLLLLLVLSEQTGVHAAGGCSGGGAWDLEDLLIDEDGLEGTWLLVLVC